MKMTIEITDEKSIFFLSLLNEFEFVKIIDSDKENDFIPDFQKEIIDKRLFDNENINEFVPWDEVKKKYEY